MRAPTTLGLAALLLLALGGLYLSHVSLAADPAHHAPQGDLLARLRATEQRAAAAEKLAADAIAHAREMRLARDAAAAGRPRSDAARVSGVWPPSRAAEPKCRVRSSQVQPRGQRVE